MKAFLYILMLSLVGCASVDKKRQLRLVNKKDTQVENDKSIITDTTIEEYGDTLKGSIPLPQITANPLKLSFGSVGSTLDLSISDKKLSYLVSSKPKGKTTIKKTLQTKTNLKSQDQSESEQQKDIKRKRKIPWWLSGVLITSLGIIYRVLKRKIQLKWI